MKLVTKTSLYYLVILILFFSLGSILFYISVNKILNEELNEQLYTEKDKFLNYVSKNDEIPPLSSLTDGYLSLSKINKKIDDVLKDTLMLEKAEDELLPYKQLAFSTEIKKQLYEIRITKPSVEKDDLLESILNSLGILFLLLIIVLFIVNRWLTKILWKSFYVTLNNLNKYDLRAHTSITFSATGIYEFDQLNLEVKRMIEKINLHYSNLKDFSENASHEIQTPLAIIQNKLELILENDNLPAIELKKIHEIYETTNRLTKLNKSLLMLSKIDNQQFGDVELILFDELVEQKLLFFEDMIGFRKLNLEKNLVRDSYIKINIYLADVLLSNLITNALKHNIEGGKIAVILTKNKIEISNSGLPKTLISSKIFERFSKENTSHDSIGLGLAIVKQICTSYQFKINYSYSKNLHTFSIEF